MHPDQMRLPRWALVPAAIGAFLVAAPVAAMLLSVDPRELPALLTSASSLDALWLSLRTSAAATSASSRARSAAAPA